MERAPLPGGTPGPSRMQYSIATVPERDHVTPAPPRSRTGVNVLSVLRSRAAFLEQALLVILAGLATMRVERIILFTPHVSATDTMLLEYWMRRFQDPGLFQDPLTHALVKTGYVPLGPQAVYWLASNVVDPVRLSAWGVLVLAPLSTWLVFRIVREHTAWIPAAWFAAALFVLSWQNQRFSGTHPRGFAQPIVLLTVYLLMRGRTRWAAAVPAVGALFYPPAALVALAVLFLTAIGARGRRLTVDRRTLIAAAASAAVVLLAYELPRIAGLSSGNLITESVARHYPEFGPNGQVPFFRDSVIKELRANYSGFAVTLGGSILMVMAAVVLALRPANCRLIRKEVWAMGAASLILFGVSWAVLFHLYLPDRYTYPLIPFYCIVIAVSWYPLWNAYGERLRWLLPVLAVGLPAAVIWFAGSKFDLGLLLPPATLWDTVADGWVIIACSLAVGAVLAAAVYLTRNDRPMGALIVLLCAVLAGSLLTGVVTVAGWQTSTGRNCGKDQALYSYLRTLPKRAIIAGDPKAIDCVPIETDRAVVISRKLYQPFDYTYLKYVRPRMEDMLRAYYGSSRRAIADLGTRYGATDLVIDRTLLNAGQPYLRFTKMDPFATVVRQAEAPPSRRAALHLPRSCEVWSEGDLAVYDIRCVGDSLSSSSG
jgi:FtsH-binding integral membrane protein